MFTDSDRLGKRSQERRWTESRQEVQNRRVHAPRRIESSGEYIAAVVADTLASRRPSDEDDGKGHPRLIFQQSCVSTCGQEDLCEQNKQPQKMFNVVAKRVSFAAHENLTATVLFFVCLFAVNICDPSLVEFFLSRAAQPYQPFFGMFQLFFLVECEWFENYSGVS